MDGEASGNIDNGKAETGRAILGSYVKSYLEKRYKQNKKGNEKIKTLVKRRECKRVFSKSYLRF